MNGKSKRERNERNVLARLMVMPAEACQSLGVNMGAGQG
jgi:hypothetical protein